MFAETNVSEVAEVAEKLTEDEVIEVEAGLRSASDGEDVDADNDDKDDKQDDGSDKSADDNQGCGGSQDTLRRSGRARRPPVEYWRPVSLVAHEAPTTYVQAVQGQESAKWQIAMDKKMEAIRKNKTWRLTDRPASRRVLKGKWVYKVKNEVDKNGNNTTRHKARLCFMGNWQIKGLDFNEKFGPVAKFTTIRCILVMTAENGWELHQMDVKTAIVNVDLDQEVYMEQQDGYVDSTNPDVAFGRGSVRYLCPYRDLRPSLRISDCGLWDGCPSLSSPPIRARGYSFVSPFRLFSSCYYSAGLAPRRPVLLAI